MFQQLALYRDLLNQLMFQNQMGMNLNMMQNIPGLNPQGLQQQGMGTASQMGAGGQMPGMGMTPPNFSSMNFFGQGGGNSLPQQQLQQMQQQSQNNKNMMDMLKMMQQQQQQMTQPEYQEKEAKQ